MFVHDLSSGRFNLKPCWFVCYGCAPTALGATNVTAVFNGVTACFGPHRCLAMECGKICGDCRIQLPKATFHGSIDIRHVGGLPLTQFSSSPLSFWKWPLDIVNSESRSCIVITQMAGVRRYLQNGAEILLKPGDSTVIDSGSPWSSSCSTDCMRLYLRVPRWMIENRLRMREIPIAQRICGSPEHRARTS